MPIIFITFTETYNIIYYFIKFIRAGIYFSKKTRVHVVARNLITYRYYCKGHVVISIN